MGRDLCRNRSHLLVGHHVEMRQGAYVMKKILPVLSAFSLVCAPVQAEVKLSDKLNRIARHLGEGGVHFSVTDSEGDLESLAGLLDEVIAVIPDADVPPGMKISSFFRELGLFSLQGTGASSSKVGDLWHNRAFVLTDGKHEGLLSLLGREPAVGGVADFAPAGADLVLETSLDLREVEKMSRKLASSLGPEAENDVVGMFGQEIPELGMTLADLFVDFSVRGTLVFWLDDEKTFELGPEMVFPVPHFSARLDNAGVVWNLIKSQLGSTSEIKEVGQEMVLAPKEGNLDAPWGSVAPRFVWNAQSKQLFFSLSAGDLAACRGEGAKLSSSADFKKATTGFPEKTNGLAYVSQDSLKTAISIAKGFKSEIPEEGLAVFDKVMPHLETLAKNGGYAAGFSVEKDGFLFVANSPLAAKGSSGMGSVFTIATLAGIATPLIVRAQEAGDDARTTVALKNYAVAQLTYKVEKGNYAKSLEDLVDANFIDQKTAADLVTADFEVTISGVANGNAKDVIGLASCYKDPESVLVARADGSVVTLTYEELEAQLEKQAK